MKTLHTPGPWRVYPNIFHNKEVIDKTTGNTWESKTVWIEDSNGLILAEAVCMTTGDFNKDLDKFEANAELIAAAPELLEALQSLLYVAERWADGVQFPSIMNAKAAIAKATGEKESV